MSIRVFLLSLSFCLCFSVSAHAQRKLPLHFKSALVKTKRAPIKITGLQRRVAQAIKDVRLPAASSPRPAPQAPGVRPHTAKKSRLLPSSLRVAVETPAALDAHLLQTVARLENPAISAFIPTNASVFFIEADWHGKKRLLGVTVAHAQDIMYDNLYIFLRLPSGEEKHFPVKFITSGTMGRADVALLDVPANAAPYIQPLKLATQPPAVGEKLRSYGFFHGDFRIVPNRTVRETTPGRVITSFEFGNLARAGACGGPLINKHNEVVGVHCGSSVHKQESYAIPVGLLTDLLESAQRGEIKTYDLVLSGRAIGTIRLDEYIAAVVTTNNGKPAGKRLLWHDEKAVDYQHLETLLPLDNVTDFSLIIIRGGPEDIGAGVEQKELLTVHLPTGEVNHTFLKKADDD